VAEESTTPEIRRPSAPVSAKWLLPTICGALCTAGWVALMIGLFAGVDMEESALGFTIALLVVVVLAAVSTVAARSAGSVVAVVAAVLYAGVWTYFRFSFDYLMPDALLYTLTAVFFLAPLVTGATALAIGLRARRRG